METHKSFNYTSGTTESVTFFSVEAISFPMEKPLNNVNFENIHQYDGFYYTGTISTVFVKNRAFKKINLKSSFLRWDFSLKS